MAQWHRGRKTYCVWMYHVDDRQLLQRRDRILDSVQAVVEVLPVQHLHITVFVSGFLSVQRVRNDDVEESLLARQAQRLQGCAFPAPRLRVGGAGCFLTGPFLYAHDMTETTKHIRAILADGQAEVRFKPFVAHITLGHFLASLPTGPIAEVMDRWRSLPPIVIQPEALELVSFDATTPVSEHHALCREAYDTRCKIGFLTAPR